MNFFFDHGWNLFGSCAVLAAYISSIPIPTTKDANNNDVALKIGSFVGLGIGIIIIVHVIWALQLRFFSGGAAAAAAATWHICSVAILEIAYFLILCQPLSTNRESVSHIPAEYAYIPLLFAAFFFAPRLIPERDADQPSSTSSSWILFSQVTSVVNSIGFFVAICFRPSSCGENMSRKLETGWTMSMFAIVVLVYAIPLPTMSPSTESEVSEEEECVNNNNDGDDNDNAPQNVCSSKSWKYVLILGLSKSIILSLGIVLFNQLKANDSSCLEHQLHQHKHDFYLLRILTNDDMLAWPSSDIIALGLFLKTSIGISLCFLSSHATSSIRIAFNSVQVSDNKKKLLELHEIKLGVVLFCIVLAAFSTGASHNYLESASNKQAILDRHSTGIIISQCILLIVIIVAWAHTWVIGKLTTTNTTSPQEKLKDK